MLPEKQAGSSSDSEDLLIIPFMLRQNLTELMKEYPEGMFMCSLIHNYEKKFSHPMDYEQFACHSIYDFVNKLSSIFDKEKRNLDWYIYPKGSAKVELGMWLFNILEHCLSF